ncbi:isopeptide-forming domain-containing fimbrial protein, partial [Bacillus cereus]|uniref:isopeptide-forming domain-containing fimbrial protein n=1 Tax=Bacillus cereus TaxID=1396 RepID=UPI003D16841F
MNHKKYLSMLMAFVISFSTFMQPVVSFAEETDNGKPKDEVKVEKVEKVGVEEPQTNIETPVKEADKVSTGTEEKSSTNNGEPVKNKGQPSEAVVGDTTPKAVETDVDITKLTEAEKTNLPIASKPDFYNFLDDFNNTPIEDWNSNYYGEYKMEFSFPNDFDLEPAKQYSYKLDIDVTKFTYVGDKWFELIGPAGTTLAGQVVGYARITSDSVVHLIFRKEFTELQNRKGTMWFNFRNFQVEKKVYYKGKEYDDVAIPNGENFQYRVHVKFDKNTTKDNFESFVDVLDPRIQVTDQELYDKFEVVDTQGYVHTDKFKRGLQYYNGKLEIIPLIPNFPNIKGKEFVLRIPARMGENVKPDEVVPNVAKYGIESNKVTVRPLPLETPKVTKDVEGKDSLVVENNKEFNYNVKTKIPTDITGYSKLTLKDVLDDRLEVVKAVAMADGNEINATPEINGQEVKVVIPTSYLNAYKGSDINLQITAKVKEGVVFDKIPNGATIQLNDKPSVDSNVVIITPPNPEKPVIQKDVEGKNHLDIETGKDYKYNVKTVVPKDVMGYKTLTMKDTLDNRLKVVKADVLVDGQASDLKAEVKGQDISLVLDRTQLDSLVGKEVNIQITSQIKDGTPIETVPNKGTIQVNDNPVIESNEVTVTPPTPEKPSIHKDVEGKDHLATEYEKEYNYNVKTTIPADVKGYKSLTIADTLDKRLDLVGAKVLVDGKESKLVADVKGQDVKLVLDRSQLDEIQGKEVNIQITSKIKDKTPIENIPNGATIQVNDEPKIDSNVVTVVPPKVVTPEITKDVEGKEHLDVMKGQEFKYHVNTTVPQDVLGYKSLTLTDKLDDRLTITDAKVLVDGVPTDVIVTIDGQTVSAVLDKKQLETFKGKSISIEITAKVKFDAPIEIINNKGTIQVNDLPSVDSNNVTVKPENRKAMLVISKQSGEEPNTFEPYELIIGRSTGLLSNLKVVERNSVINPLALLTKSKSEPIPLEGAVFEILDANKNVLHSVTTNSYGTVEVYDLELGDYFIKEIKAPEGYQLDSREYPFTIKETGLAMLSYKYTFHDVKDPETPKVTKDVEGKNHLEVEKGKEYNYNVKTTIPTDLEGYKDLTITDTLDNRLDLVDSKVFVDGEASPLVAKINGQTVTLTLTREQLNLIEGKEVNIQITSKIKENVAIETIENKANIQVNDKPSVDSNVVTVVPPTPEKPSIHKDVEGKDHLEVDTNKEYKYNVKSNI